MNKMSELQAGFSAMTEGKKEDYQIISDHFQDYSKQLPDRV